MFLIQGDKLIVTIGSLVCDRKVREIDQKSLKAKVKDHDNKLFDREIRRIAVLNIGLWGMNQIDKFLLYCFILSFYPENPWNPGKPGNPRNPRNRENPGNSGNPGNPENPENPENPVEPWEPSDNIR